MGDAHMQHDMDVVIGKSVRWRRYAATAAAALAGVVALAGPLAGSASALSLRPVPAEITEVTTTPTVVAPSVDPVVNRWSANRWFGNRWSGNRWFGNRWSSVGYE